jgi:hypothetical protein
VDPPPEVAGDPTPIHETGHLSDDHATVKLYVCRRPVGSTIAIAPSDDVFDILRTELANRVGAQTFK